MKEEKYNITFLKDYLDLIGLSPEKLAQYLGVTKSHMYRYLNGTLPINSEKMNKILLLFNVNSYEELKLLVSRSIESFNLNNNDYYLDINWLKEFLHQNKISTKVFINYLGTTKANFYKMLDKQINIKQKYLYKIHILINSEELINELSNTSIKQKNEIKDCYDISFLKPYLENNNISQTSLAKFLGISRQYMSILLNGAQDANQGHINKILSFFNIESIDQLYDLTSNENITLKRKLK